MLRNLGMIALSLVVAGAITGVLFWFLRRLNKIQDDLWGKKKK